MRKTRERGASWICRRGASVNHFTFSKCAINASGTRARVCVAKNDEIFREREDIPGI